MSTIVLIMSMHNLTLGSLMGSEIRAELLALLLTNPDKSFYIRELAALLKRSLTPLRRELVHMENLGLLKSEFRAKSKFYRANQGCPIFKELQSIVIKTSAAGEIVKESLTKIASVKFAFIYGSFAVQAIGPTSDIDLFIIGEPKAASLNAVIRKIESRTGREVQYSIFDMKEVIARVKRKDDFIMNVLNSAKIMLIGDENELRRIGT